TLPVPPKLAETLLNPIRGKNKEVYTSIADFICPADCPAPAEICTHTQKPRSAKLNRVLQAIQYDDYASVVVTSRQLGPGVGGYTPQDLFRALNAVIAAKNRILLSTACRCHGVMHAFRISEK
ncbi:MAG: potassium transporter, partial [Proteobacteria bacterium]|nr:potassium transporter [Pseudomonadota bacterium]